MTTVTRSLDPPAPEDPSADPLAGLSPAEIVELRALARRRSRRRVRAAGESWRQPIAPDMALILAGLAWVVPWIFLALGRGGPSSGLMLGGGFAVLGVMVAVGMALAAATLAVVVRCAVKRHAPAWKWIVAGLAVVPHVIVCYGLFFGW